MIIGLADCWVGLLRPEFGGKDLPASFEAATAVTWTSKHANTVQEQLSALGASDDHTLACELLSSIRNVYGVSDPVGDAIDAAPMYLLKRYKRKVQTAIGNLDPTETVNVPTCQARGAYNTVISRTRYVLGRPLPVYPAPGSDTSPPTQHLPSGTTVVMHKKKSTHTHEDEVVWMNIAQAATAAGESQDFDEEQAWAPERDGQGMFVADRRDLRTQVDGLGEQLRHSVGVTQAAVIAAVPHLAKAFGKGISLAVHAEGDSVRVQTRLTAGTANVCLATGLGRSAQVVSRVIFRELGLELPLGLEVWPPVGHQLFEARSELMADLRGVRGDDGVYTGGACAVSRGLFGVKGGYCDPRYFAKLVVGHVGHLLNVRKKGSAVRVHYQCDKDVTVHDAWAEIRLLGGHVAGGLLLSKKDPFKEVRDWGWSRVAGGSLSTCHTLIVRFENADAAAAFTNAAVRQLQTNSESLLMEGVAPVYNVHTQFNVDGFIWKKVNHGTGMTTTAMTIQATGTSTCMALTFNILVRLPACSKCACSEAIHVHVARSCMCTQ